MRMASETQKLRKSVGGGPGQTSWREAAREGLAQSRTETITHRMDTWDNNLKGNVYSALAEDESEEEEPEVGGRDGKHRPRSIPSENGPEANRDLLVRIRAAPSALRVGAWADKAPPTSWGVRGWVGGPGWLVVVFSCVAYARLKNLLWWSARRRQPRVRGGGSCGRRRRTFPVTCSGSPACASFWRGAQEKHQRRGEVVDRPRPPNVFAQCRRGRLGPAAGAGPRSDRGMRCEPARSDSPRERRL